MNFREGSISPCLGAAWCSDTRISPILPLSWTNRSRILAATQRCHSAAFLQWKSSTERDAPAGGLWDDAVRVQVCHSDSVAYWNFPFCLKGKNDNTWQSVCMN